MPEVNRPPDKPGSASMGASNCPRCRAAFTCGAKAGQAQCWCFALPPMKPSEAGAECLCPSCLAALAGSLPQA